MIQTVYAHRGEIKVETNKREGAQLAQGNIIDVITGVDSATASLLDYHLNNHQNDTTAICFSLLNHNDLLIACTRANHR